MRKLEEINNLAFDLTNEDLNSRQVFLMAKDIFKLSIPIELNDNQQIVLDWLKNHGKHPFGAIYLVRIEEAEIEVNHSVRKLSKVEQFQVLQAFAEWGLNHA